MLVVRIIYIYIIATSISHIGITLGLYVLSTILNEPNVVLQNTLLAKFYTKSIFKAFHISSVHFLALIPAVAEPTRITPAQVRESTPAGSNVLQTV
jgi:hypothetical protein